MGSSLPPPSSSYTALTSLPKQQIPFGDKVSNTSSKQSSITALMECPAICVSITMDGKGTSLLYQVAEE